MTWESILSRALQGVFSKFCSSYRIRWLCAAWQPEKCISTFTDPQALDLSAWHLLDTALNHLPASYITELTKVWLIYGLVLPEPGCRACLDESLSQSQVTEQGN